MFDVKLFDIESWKLIVWCSMWWPNVTEEWIEIFFSTVISLSVSMKLPVKKTLTVMMNWYDEVIKTAKEDSTSQEILKDFKEAFRFEITKIEIPDTVEELLK